MMEILGLEWYVWDNISIMDYSVDLFYFYSEELSEVSITHSRRTKNYEFHRHYQNVIAII